MTSITIRVDDVVKREAETLFDKLGFSISAAINVFFKQAIRDQAIPFPIRAKTAEEKYDEYFNPYNLRVLRDSIAQAERGDVISFTMSELKAMETGEIPQRALDFLEDCGGTGGAKRAR